MNAPLFSAWQKTFFFFQLQFLFIEIIADLHEIMIPLFVGNGELSKIHDSPPVAWEYPFKVLYEALTYLLIDVVAGLKWN